MPDSMRNLSETEQSIREVAQRIRTLREDMGISFETMAFKTGLSVEEYKKMEKGETDFSFTFIYKCASAFGVDIAELMEGKSPELTEYTVTRKGKGKPITRREGLSYNRLAHKFKNKMIEPYHVVIPYSEEALTRSRHFSSHAGQEMDIVIKGTLRKVIGNHIETLYEGDSIFFDSSIPHDEIALGGEDCEIYAIVIKPDGVAEVPEMKKTVKEFTHTNFDKAGIVHPVADKFVLCETDETGTLSAVKFKNEEKFNFAYDIVDAMAEKAPDKVAMVHVAEDKSERIFTYKDIKEYSCQTANYFKSLGIKKGDKVMLVLKRHYQFWFSILALHRLGAIVIPASNQLVKHDFEYRFDAAEISAIVCTADGNVADEVDLAAPNCPSLKTKIIVGKAREGWNDFNAELPAFSNEFPRTEDTACGSNPMLMFFTSGTTGYPKIAM
ncbi:MAG: AMP-binding protein, partial [Ruminococcus sp.]|nr:AMP-binding protein [Ruminococcus sp.]